MSHKNDSFINLSITAEHMQRGDYKAAQISATAAQVEITAALVEAQEAANEQARIANLIALSQFNPVLGDDIEGQTETLVSAGIWGLTELEDVPPVVHTDPPEQIPVIRPEIARALKIGDAE